MEIVYVKIISGKDYRIEGDELEVKSDAYGLQIAAKREKYIFPWKNIEYVHITEEKWQNGENTGMD